MLGEIREGSELMRRLLGVLGRFAILLLVMAGAARAQGQGLRLSDAVSETNRFGSVRLLQDVKFETQGGVQTGSPATKTAKPAAHRFWDTQNVLLFAGVGAARGLDYASTLNIRRRGINEALLTNAVVDNHAEFAAIEVATAAAAVGLSAIWHYTGHHKLERWTSYIHIGVTVAGAGRNYALKTPHPAM
jgi:hypothetical protein